jgi:hypothetical protein
MLGSDIRPKQQSPHAEETKEANGTERKPLAAYRMKLPALHSLLRVAVLARRLLQSATEGCSFPVLKPYIWFPSCCGQSMQ